MALFAGKARRALGTLARLPSPLRGGVRGGEIHDKRTDKSLPPKMRAHQRNVMAKPLPKHALGIDRLRAHPTRKLLLAINHRAGFNHIGRHLWTPTPDPSPKGEGRRGVAELEKP